MKYKLINYHCRHCGAPVEPGKERCLYCEQIARYQKYIGERNNLVSVLVDCGNDFVNFNEILSVSDLTPEPDVIDCTTLDGNKRTIIGATESMGFSATIYVNNRAIELCEKIQPDKRYRVRFELNGKDVAYETKAYILRDFNYLEENALMKFDLNFWRDDDMKFLHLETPKGLTCPNCGAPVISRYGACGYCGGWLEYVS